MKKELSRCGFSSEMVSLSNGIRPICRLSTWIYPITPSCSRIMSQTCNLRGTTSKRYFLSLPKKYNKKAKKLVATRRVTDH